MYTDVLQLLSLVHFLGQGRRAAGTRSGLCGFT